MHCPISRLCPSASREVELRPLTSHARGAKGAESHAGAACVLHSVIRVKKRWTNELLNDLS